MNDDANDKVLPPAWLRRILRPEREPSGIQPFFRLRARGRERCISRVVAVNRSSRKAAGMALELEIYFALG